MCWHYYIIKYQYFFHQKSPWNRGKITVCSYVKEKYYFNDALMH